MNREVPLLLRLGVRFGGTVQQIGWIFLATGWLFPLFLLPMIDFSPPFYLGEISTTNGTVLEVESTSVSVNDETVYRVDFTWEDLLGETRVASSYTTGELPHEDQVVAVEYPDRYSEYARIEGMGNGAMPLWVAPLIMIFPLVGFGLALGGLVKGSRNSKLVSRGVLTEGLLIHRRPTNTKINSRTVYALTFEYQDNKGNSHELVSKTHEPEKLEDDPLEWVLFDPDHPHVSCTLDDLPGNLRVEDDRIVGDQAKAFRRLIAPTLAVGLNVLFLLVMGLTWR
ncbi:MAG: hypothetical protein HN348_19960 [Proteobacteria bacterium]|nr:hypothetical protein [Pseudomonadota bacterium]